MISPQSSKFVGLTPPAAIIDNASATTNVIDTAGFSYAVITCYIGALDIAMSALKLQEADAASSATALTSGADITGFVGGTDFTLPIATDDNKAVRFFVDLRGRKRYLDLVATLGDGSAGTFFTAWCDLYRGEKTPSTATERGLLVQVIG